MPNVVVDASTVASAALKRNSTPETALLFALTYDNLYVSEPVIEEIRDVLTRPKFHKYLEEERVAEIIALILADARLVTPTERITACRDPADDKYLELAMAAGAHAIVTSDHDLLSMSPFRETQILNAAQYISLIKRREHLPPSGGASGAP